MHFRWARPLVFIVLMAVAHAFPVGTQDTERLSEDQMRDFLLHAKVVKSRQVGLGRTGVMRLTLSHGTLTHDAAFQSIDDFKANAIADNGIREINFKDSYKFDIAAYELAVLLGLGDMMPVTVERLWSGKTGALSWWLPYKLDEEARQKKRIKVPDEAAWARQVNRMFIFSELVYDTDRNLGNALYSDDWHLWMIDFTRAFRLNPDLHDPKSLGQCDRQLWDSLRQLDPARVREKTAPWLNEMEYKALMARRDKIVALFEKLIAEKGEKAVIYR